MKVYVVSEENQSSCCYGVTNVGVTIDNKEKAFEMAEEDFKKQNRNNRQYSKTVAEECLDEWKITFKLDIDFGMKYIYLVSEYEVK